MDIVYSMCDCPAFAQYPGLCKHCVAVLLEADEREMAEVLGLDFQEEDILEVLQNSLQEIQGAAKAPLDHRAAFRRKDFHSMYKFQLLSITDIFFGRNCVRKRNHIFQHIKFFSPNAESDIHSAGWC